MMLIIGIILWLACLVIFPPLSVLIAIAWVWWVMSEDENRQAQSQGRSHYWNADE